MNREETKRAIEVMQAFVDGAEIQIGLDPNGDSPPRWMDLDDCPRWEWGLVEYRVKPREFWLWPTPDGTYVYDPAVYPEPDGDEWIKVREVIE